MSLRVVRAAACVPALAGLLACAATGMGFRAVAEEPGPPAAGLARNAAWRLERLTLTDGRVLEGLVLDPPADAGGDGDVGFVEIVRRPGRPMHLVSRLIPPSRVGSIDRLPTADRAALADRIDTFRAGSRQEREAAAGLQLSRRGDDGPWCYAGPMFDVESLAGQPLTRLAIVRLEGLLAAFETLVPPSAAPAPGRRLTVRLCGSPAEYARTQAEHGVEVANPAFYLPGQALLVAGGDVPVVLAQAQLAADGLATTEQRQDELDDEVAAGLQRLADQLEAQGIPASQRAEIVARTRARWQREKGAVLARVERARKGNAARVASAQRDFLTWLAHEAWHAYANLRLAPAGGMPPWLDEGLAQVFECGLLEAGELRLDAPDAERLTRLATVLADRPPGVLAPLVAGDEAQFVVGRGHAAATSREAYLLAWGLAYDLALGAPVLSASSIRSLAASTDDGAARFGRLVGMPLADFETGWRGRMLALAQRPRGVTARPVVPADGPPVPTTDAATPAGPDR